MNGSRKFASGFESDDFQESAEDGFSEALNSAIGESVELCNADLSSRTSIRAIVEGSVQDTHLNALQRKFLTKIGTCKAGQYIFYKNCYWLIIGLVDDNHLYEKSVAILCNYYLTWLNNAGKIVQRWCSISSASQYNNGETSTEFMFYRTDQLMVLLPQDYECLTIPHKKRFVIDLRTKIYDKELPDGTKTDNSKDLLTYELTRNDNVLFNYNDSGHFEFMAYQDEQHPNDGYYLVDGHGYWLCDIPENPEVSPNTSRIDCDEPIVYCGAGPSVFLARFFNSDGTEVDSTPNWSIQSDFDHDVLLNRQGNSIYISVTNARLIGKTFQLVLNADGYKEISLAVRIAALI